MDQGELVLRPQGVEAASGGRDGSGLQDAMVIVPSGTADGPPMTYVEPVGTPGGERRSRSGSPFEELARSWFKQRGMHRAIIPLWLSGKTASGLRQGGNTCQQQVTGYSNTHRGV